MARNILMGNYYNILLVYIVLFIYHICYYIFSIEGLDLGILHTYFLASSKRGMINVVKIPRF